MVTLQTAERIRVLESLVSYIMDKNISLQEPFVKFKDLLARMVAEEHVRSRLHDVSGSFASFLSQDNEI